MPRKAAKKKKTYTQIIFRDWCKGCGICIAFCPKEVFSRDPAGKAVSSQPARCSGCRFCEQHCPDLAITIKECLAADERTKNKTPKTISRKEAQKAQGTS